MRDVLRVYTLRLQGNRTCAHMDIYLYVDANREKFLSVIPAEVNVKSAITQYIPYQHTSSALRTWTS